MKDKALKEKENWDEYFDQSLEGKGQEHKNKLWWDVVDRDACEIVVNRLAGKKEISVLEAGCGSGKTTFQLANFIRINLLYLMDISDKALSFAKSIENSKLKGKVKYAQGDIFNMKFDINFDLVWNIGLIEHYSEEEIEKIVRNMYNAVNDDGVMIIGIPNRRSIAVLKAALLGSVFGKFFLFWAPGYRNDSEILYGEKKIKKIIKKVTNKEAEIGYAGSFLWVGCFRSLIKFFDKKFKKSKFSFLTLFSVIK